MKTYLYLSFASLLLLLFVYYLPQQDKEINNSHLESYKKELIREINSYEYNIEKEIKYYSQQKEYTYIKEIVNELKKHVNNSFNVEELDLLTLYFLDIKEE